MCGQDYDMNNREIPRISITKKVSINDLTDKDIIANPDYCNYCTLVILKFLQRKRELRYKFNNFHTNQNKPISVDTRY